ncbi:MAG: DUF2007 domain-containing protein [Chloroflexi bacterium]|nr:DUF2007 domain-containing protein [Chloroflexota bacterium]
MYVARGRMEAEVVRGRLDAEHIPALIVYESVGQTFGITVDGLGQVQVKVPAPFADEARQILTDADA